MVCKQANLDDIVYILLFWKRMIKIAKCKIIILSRKHVRLIHSIKPKVDFHLFDLPSLPLRSSSNVDCFSFRLDGYISTQDLNFC